MPEMFDPEGNLDLRLPQIIDSSELTDEAARAGLREEEEVVHPDLQPDAVARHGGEINGDASAGYWIPLPAPPRSTPDMVWHYTDAVGAIGIISSGEVWATSINALNDRGEFAYGIGLLQEQLALVLRSRQVHPDQKAFMKDAVRLAKSSTEVAPVRVLRI
jgi:hypothetical protein